MKTDASGKPQGDGTKHANSSLLLPNERHLLLRCGFYVAVRGMVEQGGNFVVLLLLPFNVRIESLVIAGVEFAIHDLVDGGANGVRHLVDHFSDQVGDHGVRKAVAEGILVGLA